MEDFITNIINDVIRNFDIPFCITVNIATYVIIRVLTDTKKCRTITTWQKRIIFLATSIIIGVIYYISDNTDYKIIFNSIILAPVSWSWIFKPICTKLKIDYNSDCDCES